jgi:hypothetical protein
VRGDTWTPLRVQIVTDDAQPSEYVLEVAQLDADGDEVVYTRPIVVNPGANTFWTYFKPSPINGGIGAAQFTSETAKVLRVFVSTPNGQRRLVQANLANQSPIVLEDDSQGNRLMGAKLLVTVGREASFAEFAKDSGVAGVNERVAALPVDPRRLPDNAIGYDAVDALLWTDADPSQLSDAQFRALRQWVRGGGRLVIVQNAEVARMARLNEFLPVSVPRTEDWGKNRQPLADILSPPDTAKLTDRGGRPIDVFANTTPPFRMARAAPLPSAVVDTWVTWPDGTHTPYIARHLFGLGSVTWLAQDIADETLRRAPYGWPRLWNRVFDWRASDLTLPYLETKSDVRERLQRRFAVSGVKDVGAAFRQGTNLESKTAALVSLAFVFFVGYWLIAGPGAYLVLAAKKRAHWSWFVYGGIALVATLLTVGITQLVLRGSAQIRHVTLVRSLADSGEPGRVQSRFGIYLPQDTSGTPITLSKRDTAGPTTLTPLVTHYRFAGGDSVPLRDSRCAVPLPGEDAPEETTLDVPFRSTLKKLQADYTGPVPGRISGKPVLTTDPRAPLVGQLFNNTGRDLSSVLMVFRYPQYVDTASGQVSSVDLVLFLRTWEAGKTVDLKDLFARADNKLEDGVLKLDDDLQWGRWQSVIDGFYAKYLRTQTFGSGIAADDSGSDYPYSFFVASLFDMMPVMTNLPQQSGRSELMRIGVRQWDVSGAVASGAMVVLARTPRSPVPLPLTVDGYAPEGDGQTFWQSIHPIDHSRIDLFKQAAADKQDAN